MPLKVEIPDELFKVEYANIKYRADKMIEQELRDLAKTGGPAARALYWLDVPTMFLMTYEVASNLKRVEALLADKRRDEKVADALSKMRVTGHRDVTVQNVVSMLERWRDFLRSWLPTAEALKAARDRAIKGRRPVGDPKTPPRTLENTGTCAICGQNVKLRTGDVLHDHGYQIAGGTRSTKSGRLWGYRMGRCYGVGRKPIELSAEAAESYLADILRPQAAAIEKSLAEHRAMPANQVVGKNPRTLRDITAAHVVAEMEWEKRMLDDTIKTFEEKVRNWKPSALPGETKVRRRA